MEHLGRETAPTEPAPIPKATRRTKRFRTALDQPTLLRPPVSEPRRQPPPKSRDSLPLVHGPYPQCQGLRPCALRCCLPARTRHRLAYAQDSEPPPSTTHDNVRGGAYYDRKETDTQCREQRSRSMRSFPPFRRIVTIDDDQAPVRPVEGQEIDPVPLVPDAWLPLPADEGGLRRTPPSGPCPGPSSSSYAIRVPRRRVRDKHHLPGSPMRGS